MGTARRVYRMAKRRDSAALDRRRHDGGSQKLPSIESIQALPVLGAALAAASKRLHHS